MAELTVIEPARIAPRASPALARLRDFAEQPAIKRSLPLLALAGLATPEAILDAVYVDGRAVEKQGDLPRFVGGIKPGNKSTLQVFRRGATRDLSLTVAEFEADRPTRRASAPEPGSSAPMAKAILGLTVSDLTDGQKRDLRIRGGVKVEAVDGPAARAGVREGDVILSMDNIEIADSKQFTTVATKAEKARAVSVMVRRGDWTNYLVIRPVR